MRTEFWNFVREREAVRARKELGLPPPYSEDPRLRHYRFPNIRRMDDPSTVWLHGALLSQLEDLVQIVLAAATFRALGGKVSSAERLVPMFLGPGFDEGLMLDALGPLKAPFNGAVGQHQRMADLAGLAAATAAIQAADGFLVLIRDAPLETATGALKGVPKIGQEMAYEIACDLRRTPVLMGPPDARTWALPGLSAVRAAGRITGEERRHTRHDDREAAIALMRELLEEARPDFPDWELSEVQRALTMYEFWARDDAPPRRYRWK